LQKSVSVVIPAYNEADVIGDTVRGALTIPGVVEVIVIDDGSTDNTTQVARDAGAQVVKLPNNVGKGGALNSGWQKAKGQVILLLDADLGESAREGALLVEPVACDKADMAIAMFVRGSEEPNPEACDKRNILRTRSGGFGTVVRLAKLGIWILTGRWMESPLAGPRALKREIIERAGRFADKFGVEVGLTVDALRMGYRVMEVPVKMVHRASGRDIRGFLHRGRQMVDVIRTLMNKALKI
jgi:glycosyltransferase involved in cell wall biosynthesis